MWITLVCCATVQCARVGVFDPRGYGVLFWGYRGRITGGHGATHPWGMGVQRSLGLWGFKEFPRFTRLVDFWLTVGGVEDGSYENLILRFEQGLELINSW